MIRSSLRRSSDIIGFGAAPRCGGRLRPGGGGGRRLLVAVVAPYVLVGSLAGDGLEFLVDDLRRGLPIQPGQLEIPAAAPGRAPGREQVNGCSGFLREPRRQRHRESRPAEERSPVAVARGGDLIRQ